MLWLFRRHKEKLEYFFGWVSGAARENDIIFADLDDCRGYFKFDFPLRIGDRPKRVKNLVDENDLAFLVRKPGAGKIGNFWVAIFSDAELEILENKNRFADSDLKPLRYGLNNEEKKKCLEIARNTLENFLHEGKTTEQKDLNFLPGRFQLRTDLDVALWVDGRLRGSAVVENMGLGAGIARAAVLASRDVRFKPLAYEELSRARIEITIMLTPFVPLSKTDFAKNEISSEKGYVLEYGNKKSWYLPEVFNVRRFRNLDEFLGDLAQEKAGLERGAYKSKDAKVFVFEVIDFIEPENRESVLSLRGPMIESKLKSKFLNLKSVCKNTVDWLCCIQEPDGNIPPIVDPLTGFKAQMDWPRLVFTAWSLAEFGKAVGEQKYADAAQKCYDYAKKYLLPGSVLESGAGGLTLAYLGNLAMALGRIKDLDEIIAGFSRTKWRENFEPIAFSQIASFSNHIYQYGRRLPVTSEELFDILKNRFKLELKSGRSVNLAVWAELINTFFKTDPEFSRKICDWLKSQQLPDGSFPGSTTSDFAYTRGVAKIFEVLALQPEENKEAMEKVLFWIFSMQYDQENTFFVPEKIRPKIIGGFRHDYLNQEAWIDASGHLLLGAARLIGGEGHRGLPR